MRGVQRRGLNEIGNELLPDVWVTCDICKGKRYTRETLEVKWRGKTIFDILEMPVEEATKFFENQKKIHRILSTLEDVGLGYIRLGQLATTLSGGVAQRVKLATELHRPARNIQCISLTNRQPDWQCQTFTTRRMSYLDCEEMGILS